MAESDDTYLDDIEDRRFLPSHIQMRIVTGGHLGRSRDEQVRTANAIGVPLLSSTVTLAWHGGDETAVDNDWISRFAIIYQLLQRVRKSERAVSDGTSDDTGTPPVLVYTCELAVDVRVGSDAPEHVPVNARFHQGILTVAGRPVEFGADAAKELLREFSFGQRGDLAADLTGMLSAIGTEEDFRLSVDKFGRSHVPDFKLTEVVDAGVVDAPAGTPGESGSTGGSYNKARALAKQNNLAEQLKSSLKGEIAPSHGEDGKDELGTTNGDVSAGLGDEEYREVAARYEREADREPELGDAHQTGWDNP